MDKFHLIVNSDKDKTFATSQKIMAYLAAHGKSCGCNAIDAFSDRNYRYTDPKFIPEDVECVIVLGGDGTLIQAARDMADRRIPLTGINLGTLGYLTETDREGIIPMLDCLIKNEFEIEERMMISGKIHRNGIIVKEDMALNDIVISRNGVAGVLRFKISVNGEFLNLYTADGIIYATPTGSTAYNLSAGGPIVTPSASMILMTPICPHTLNSRSIILSGEDKIEVEICAKTANEGQLVAFDGDVALKLQIGDIVEISQSTRKTVMIKLSKISFFQNLRRKMADL